MKKNLCKCILLLIVHYFILTTTCYSQELDFSFGSGTGKVMIPIENEDQCNSLALQQDGKIVLGGSSKDGSLNLGLSIVRLNQDGTIDNNYNSNGKKVINFTTQGGECKSLKLNSVGNIIAAGIITNNTAPHNADNLIINSNGDGTMNSGFNSNGIDSFSIGGVFDYINSVNIQKADDKIILTGVSLNTSNNFDISVLRLNTNGSFDNTFNSNGKLKILLSSEAIAKSSVIQKDKKILIVGSFNGNFLIIRLNADGSFDNTFGGGSGKMEVDFGTTQDDAFSIALQKDGKIIVGGQTGAQFACARLNTDGSLDNTFGADLNGRISFSIGGISNRCNSIAVDTFATINKILLTGYSYDGHSSSFATARLNLSGNIEAKSIIPMGVSSNVGQATGVAIQPDSKIVVAGYASNGTDDDFAVIRLLPDFVTTAITEPENIVNAGVNVFPNPASYQLNIHSSYNISNITIYNTLGEQVMSVANNHDVSAVVDISSLNKGIYTAVISTDKGNAIKKVVKQ